MDLWPEKPGVFGGVIPLFAVDHPTSDRRLEKNTRTVQREKGRRVRVTRHCSTLGRTKALRRERTKTSDQPRNQEHGPKDQQDSAATMWRSPSQPRVVTACVWKLNP